MGRKQIGFVGNTLNHLMQDLAVGLATAAVMARPEFQMHG